MLHVNSVVLNSYKLLDLYLMGSYESADRIGWSNPCGAKNIKVYQIVISYLPGQSKGNGKINMYSRLHR